MSKRLVVIATLMLTGCGGRGGDDPDTTALSGDPSHWNAFSGLPQAQAFAGASARLLQIEAYFVRSDGTQDLAASFHPYTDYHFRLASPPPSNVPLGAPGAPTDSIQVRVEDPGSIADIQSGESHYQQVNRGLRRGPDSMGSDVAPVAAPGCTTRALWQAATSRGAPSSAVASITYDANGYQLSITSTPYFYHYGPDCQIRDQAIDVPAPAPAVAPEPEPM